jgi:hypothetical protein
MSCMVDMFFFFLFFFFFFFFFFFYCGGVGGRELNDMNMYSKLFCEACMQ